MSKFANVFSTQAGAKGSLSNAFKVGKLGKRMGLDAQQAIRLQSIWRKYKDMDSKKITYEATSDNAKTPAYAEGKKTAALPGTAPKEAQEAKDELLGFLLSAAHERAMEQAGTLRAKFKNARRAFAAMSAAREIASEKELAENFDMKAARPLSIAASEASKLMFRYVLPATGVMAVASGLALGLVPMPASATAATFVLAAVAIGTFMYAVVENYKLMLNNALLKALQRVDKPRE